MSLAFEPSSALALLNKLEATLRALPADSLVRQRVTRETALALTAKVLELAEALKALIEGTLLPHAAAPRLEELATLANRALAFYMADLLIESGWTPERKQRRAELAARLREHDVAFLTWARALFLGDAAVTAEIDKIASGTGHRDDADDVLRLTALFARHWERVKDYLPFDAAAREQAAAEATAMLALLDSAGAETDPSRDLARRAYSYWANAYDEIVALGRYLLRREADIKAKLPGLVEPRTATTAAASVPEAPVAPAPAESEA